MSTDSITVQPIAPVVDRSILDESHADKMEVDSKEAPPSAFLHSPPDSNNAIKTDGSDSELSDLEDLPNIDDMPELPSAAEVDDDDIGEVEPNHWSGTVPVFKPTMHQFKDFKKFMSKVDCYGMKSGIIKIIPPEEWKNSQPQLDDLVKQIRVREPIKQDIMGSNGTYRQVNILHGRSYNLPQWRKLCDQSEHQPPARRGERRANVEKAKAPPRPRPAPRQAPPRPSALTDPSTPKKRGRGRPPKNKVKSKPMEEEEKERPMTPESPKPNDETMDAQANDVMQTVESEAKAKVETPRPRSPTPVRRMGAVRPAKEKTQSVSARRKYSQREGSAAIDEEAFKDFHYKMDISDYTEERCEELERAYWKTLTYAPPLYGADMMGTLFDSETDIWNLNKLPNLLDVLGTKIPGVNTAYLYLGMWKATFAWHLEDVDLYSINYLHFGAPKQWYSISQADAPRFEAAMKNIWPQDAKSCSQFLRHKGYLISPQHLLQHHGIKVNKCLSYPGEFVVTYPYGYHSGYNLGYNCAEAVNFALDAWLPMGKIAKRCECAQAQDSVWIDVYEIERKLRGEETEYEETEIEDYEDDELSGLPTPPASHAIRFKEPSHKGKRGPGARKIKIKIKKIKLRVKSKAEPPCCLCPVDFPGLELLETNDGRKAHRMCASYIPETYIENTNGKDLVHDINQIHKDRLDLKCMFCRSKRGACFQCSQKKCARAYHASCAAAAGVFIEEQDIPVFGDDGIEYKEQAFEFSCRFHRSRRDKKLSGDDLESEEAIGASALATNKGDIRQFQYLRGDIFAGIVVENRVDEQMLLIDVIPSSERVEVEWKWLLVPDLSDYHLPKASPNALPLPASYKARKQLNAKRQEDDKPRKDDVFVDGYTWAEYQTEDVVNKDQVNIDLEKQDQMWYYLGETSTEAKAQYTENPLKKEHNPRGAFLDTVPKPPKAQKLAVSNRHPSSSGNFASPYIPLGPSQLYQQGLTSTANTFNAMHQMSSSPAALLFQQADSVIQQAVESSIHSSVYTKYPFFQINYNRSPSSYRSPYLPTSAHTTAQLDQMHRPSQSFTPVRTMAKPKPKTNQVTKAYKIPDTQSPVPLPANFLAAMATSPSSPSTVPPTPTPTMAQIPIYNKPSNPETKTLNISSVNITPHSRPTGVLEDTAKSPIPRQEFADVPGSESMQFVEDMMQNLRRMSQGQRS